MTRKLIPIRRVEGIPEEMSDEALMAATATGSSAALGALFDRHHALVHRFVARISLVPDSDVDDLVQTTFASLPELAKKYRGDSQVSTFILGIARNKARGHSRATRRRGRLADEAKKVVGPRSVDIRDELSARAEIEELQAALGALAPKLREAFVLVYLEGLSGEDAAKALGIRQGALWKRLHSARKNIQLAMQRGQQP